MDTAYLNEGNMPENKKKNNKKLIIIVAVVLLALIVGGIFLFGGKGKSLEHYLDLGDSNPMKDYITDYSCKTFSIDGFEGYE